MKIMVKKNYWATWYTKYWETKYHPTQHHDFNINARLINLVNKKHDRKGYITIFKESGLEKIKLKTKKVNKVLKIPQQTTSPY